MNNKQLKVFQVTTRLSMGGAPLYVYRLALYLQRQGHNVSLVYGRAEPNEGQLFDYIDKNESYFSKIEIRELGRNIYFFQDLKALIKLILLFWREQPDIVHTHTSKAGCLGRVAAFITHVPIIVHTSHGTIIRGYFSPLKTRILIQIERLLKLITHYIMSVTELDRQDLIRHSMAYSDKSSTVHAGFDLEKFKKIGEYKDLLRKEIRINESVKVVGTVARLAPVKALDDLLYAAKIILDKNKDVHFVIAGDGESRQLLEDQSKKLGIENKVTFLGFRADLEVLYAGFDIMVVSSLNEGCPASILEAMAAKIPVVATSVGGVPEIIEAGLTGLLVPPRTPQKLAESILRLIDNPEYGIELAQNAEENAFREYSINVSTSRTEILYFKLYEKLEFGHE